MIDSPVRRSLLWYAAAALLALAGACCVLRLWQANLRVPFAYEVDGLYTELMIKGLIENGWYLKNDRVGAPLGMNLADYPMSDNLHFAALKLLGAATGDVGLTINLYFLLTFPLAAVAALFALRRLGLSPAAALVAAVLFALLPYHFLRGEWHLFLSGYYLVPLAALAALWLYAGETVRLGRKSLAAAAVCLLLPATGVYYAFFACPLLLAAGLAAALRQRAWRPLLAGALLVALVVASGLANLAPNLLYAATHGHNELAAARSPGDAEANGLKIAQLVLPITHHRLKPLAALKARYNDMPYTGENDFSSLGTVGAAGFVALLAWALFRRRGGEPQLPDGLCLLNLVAVLLGTIGGLGSLVSIAVTAHIRGYNRVSVYIAFFALALVGWALDRLAARHATSPRGRRLLYGGLALLLVLGALDQTCPGHAPDHRTQRARFAGDAAFVAAIEARLPPGTPVMQLPYQPFPEHPPAHHMLYYGHLRAYLHSRSLRWSFGAVKGREADLWQQNAAERPTDEFVRTLALAGFGGIYVDRDGYADDGKALARDLDRLLAVEPLRSADQRLAFYDLTEYARALRSRLGEEAWQAAHEAALHPVLFGWGSGFCYPPEEAEGRRWRWCGPLGELDVYNRTGRDTRVTLSMGLRSATGARAQVRVRGAGLAEELSIDGNGLALTRTITVPPGQHRILFTTDAPRLVFPGDFRDLRFRVENFTATQSDGPDALAARSRP
jgi:phosphoglycerol transferase